MKRMTTNQMVAAFDLVKQGIDNPTDEQIKQRAKELAKLRRIDTEQRKQAGYYE